MRAYIAAVVLFSGGVLFGQPQTNAWTTDTGAPVADHQDSLPVGEDGPLLQDLPLY